MTSKNKRNLSEAAVDEIVIREADDHSAWEEPIHVPAKRWAERVRVRRLDLATKFHVLSVLYCMGADATVSVGSEKDVDITVVKKPGQVLTIDVKAALESKSWKLQDFTFGRGHFIVFVHFTRRRSTPQPVLEAYVLSSRDLRSWAREHGGLVEMRQLAKSAKDAREAWDRLLPAA